MRHTLRFIAGLSVFLAGVMPVFAASGVTPAVSPTPKAAAVPVGEATRTEYFLPYPGILPTHPLYPLKRLRDSIIEALISDPGSKTEFYILQADKALNMSIMLGDGKNPEAAARAAASAGELHDKALQTAQSASSSVGAHVVERLYRSLSRHLELREEHALPESGVAGQIQKAAALLGR